jgi:hypothetical protein
MDHRAKITGLYGKRAAPPDTYAGAPDRAAETKAQLVVRNKELIEQMYVAVLEDRVPHSLPLATRVASRQRAFVERCIKDVTLKLDGVQDPREMVPSPRWRREPS